MVGSTGSTHLPAQQDLANEGLILKAPRDQMGRPTLGGIPLMAKLGQGGMGAVYYGVHPRLNVPASWRIAGRA